MKMLDWKRTGCLGVPLVEMPGYVQWAMMMSQLRYVGSNIYKRIKLIQRAFPKFFPWETKYNAIPKEVHEAFQKECYPGRYEWTGMAGTSVFPKFDESGEKKSMPGLLAQMESAAVEHKPLTENDIRDFFKTLQEHDKKKFARRKEVKRIWDKHYRVYGLECREPEFNN